VPSQEFEILSTGELVLLAPIFVPPSPSQLGNIKLAKPITPQESGTT
jgi:hypothetical protein